MKQIAVLVAGLMCAGANASFAVDAPKQNTASATLAGVTAAELPAKAADVVKHAKSRERQNVTENVVRAALQINPAAIPQVVGAIAKAAPDMAPVAASVAAAEQPKLASAVARAAAAAAPSKAGKIVAAVCRAVPNDYRNIAVAVAQVAPGSGEEILKSVGEALPSMKASIATALAGYKGNQPSVDFVLATAQPATTQIDGTATPTTTSTSPTRTVRGPSSGQPYVPLSGTPTTIPTTSSGSVPTGGRNGLNYATP